MKEQGNMTPPKVDSNDFKMDEMPNNEFKSIIIKMINEFRGYEQTAE
jgi:hypothetical protein